MILPPPLWRMFITSAKEGRIDNGRAHWVYLSKIIYRIFVLYLWSGKGNVFIHDEVKSTLLYDILLCYRFCSYFDSQRLQHTSRYVLFWIRTYAFLRCLGPTIIPPGMKANEAKLPYNLLSMTEQAVMRHCETFPGTPNQRFF